jgi:hypothetical protein
MIEDAVNRYDLEFDRPRRVENTEANSVGEVIIAQEVKGILAEGPDLKIEIVPKSEISTLLMQEHQKEKRMYLTARY